MDILEMAILNAQIPEYIQFKSLSLNPWSIFGSYLSISLSIDSYLVCVLLPEWPNPNAESGSQFFSLGHYVPQFIQLSTSRQYENQLEFAD